MRQVKWTKGQREMVRLKLARGASPEAVKESFARMVDEEASPDWEVRRLRQENKRLMALLEEKTKPIVESGGKLVPTVK